MTADATALLGLLLDTSDVAYDEASGGVLFDVVRCLSCDLVVEVLECQAGLALDAFFC